MKLYSSDNNFENKLTTFNRKITSNETKFLEVYKELNSVTTKDYNFSWGKIYCTSNDAFQNTFIYQPTLDTLELKKENDIDYVLS